MTRHPRVVEFMADIIRFVEDLVGTKATPMSRRGHVYFEWKVSQYANKADLELRLVGQMRRPLVRKSSGLALWKAAVR